MREVMFSNAARLPPGHEIVFRTARVIHVPGFLFSMFEDGLCCSMEIERGSGSEYRGIARWAGYGDDWRRYSIDHDLLHHAVSDALGRPSIALRRAACGLGPSQESEVEELAVRSFQRLHRGCALEPFEADAIQGFRRAAGVSVPDPS